MTHAPPRACVMYCHERTSTRETVERKMWNKIVIFVFFAQKVFSWLHKITVDRLMSHGLLCRSSWYFSGPWSCKDPCCLWEGQRALRFQQKYLHLCSKDERRSYRFGTTSGWVINDIIFIFGWPNPLRPWYTHSTVLFHSSLMSKKFTQKRHSTHGLR